MTIIPSEAFGRPASAAIAMETSLATTKERKRAREAVKRTPAQAPLFSQVNNVQNLAVLVETERGKTKLRR
jgi:hypothetical protein